MRKKKAASSLYKEKIFILNGPEETAALGKEIGSSLSKGSVLALSGELGSGKTTFVKGIAEGLGLAGSHEINSPTFNYMNVYETTLPLYHFDLYRLRSPQEFLESGFVEFLSEGIACIEWPEPALPFLPASTYFISFMHTGVKSRKVSMNQTLP